MFLEDVTRGIFVFVLNCITNPDEKVILTTQQSIALNTINSGQFD